MKSNQWNRNSFDWRRVDWKTLDQNRGSVLLLVAVLVLVWGLLTSLYTVQAESQGVVQRFGKYIKTVDSGLRLKLPFGIDRVNIVPVKRQMKQEFGFGTEGATNRWQSSSNRKPSVAWSLEISTPPMSNGSFNTGF